MKSWTATVGAAGLLLLLARPGQAESPGVDLTSLRTPLHHEGSPGSEPTQTQPAGEHQVGLLMGYGLDAVELEDSSGRRLATPVRHQWLMHYIGTLGVGDHLSFGVDVPVAVYQSGDDTTQLFSDGGSLTNTAFGDLALRVKASLLDAAHSRGFGLGLLGSVQTPTGDPHSYVSDEATRLGIRALTELEALALVARASAGATFRSSKKEFLNERFGHTLPWSVAIGLRPQVWGWDPQGHWRVTLESHGAVAIDPGFADEVASPAVAGLNARYSVGDVGILLGAELPLNGAAGVPRVRGLLGINWAPRHRDRDNDSLEDDRDLCPELAEDLDGFEDDDGCPDHDDDLDGVPDDQDRCPDSREDADGFEDSDGCEDTDNDQDGVTDDRDACPDQPGDNVEGMRELGCPMRDRDQDGIFDDFDDCPNEPEDPDGYFDQDGCPDPDNDGDGISDKRDRCPNQKGERSSLSRYRGCPNPDPDGDTFAGSDDQCPDRAEDFDGDQDRDGCPDEVAEGARVAPPLALAKVASVGERRFIEFSQPLSMTRLDDDSFVIDEVERPKLRAAAQLLNAEVDGFARVAVKVRGKTDERDARRQAKLIARELKRLTFGLRTARVVAFDGFEEHAASVRNGMGIELARVKRKVRIPRAPKRRKLDQHRRETDPKTPAPSLPPPVREPEPPQ